MAASSAFPREITPPAMGVRAFILSKQQYLDAGGLLDLMMTDHDICRTGAFIGRLEECDGPSPQDNLHCVNIVKDTVRRDNINKETGRPFFDPTLIQRSNVWPEKNVYHMIPASNEEMDQKPVQKLRKEFKQAVLEHDFLERREENLTELEKIYNTSGVSGVLDRFFKVAAQKNKKILYAVHIELEQDLKTTGDLSMKDMKSFIHCLPGERCPGVNCPAVFIGQDGATFNPHIEDCAFQAINRLIAGAPKVWFIIPPRFYTAFINLLRKLGASADERGCQYLLNHNNTFLDPRTVIQYGIPVFTVVQKPGDIVYLLPHTIHWGINLGYNINEGINAASSSWAKSGMLAPGRCRCVSAEDDFQPFDIVPILRAMKVDEAAIAKYEKGKVADVMHVTDVLHPENGAPHTVTIQMENLLGQDFKDVEVGKQFNVAAVTEEQAERTECWGGYEDVIDLSQSDEEEEEEEAPARNKLTCPKQSCGKSYQGGIVKRLRQHIEKEHGDDADLEQYRRAVDELFPPRNKTRRLECSRCGKQIAGSATHMDLHQNSKSCVRQ